MMGKLSIVIPARNEEECVGQTVGSLAAILTREGIDFEIIVVDDYSTDRTAEVIHAIARDWPNVRCVPNVRRSGFGNAVHTGLDAFIGEAVIIVMADASDEPLDVVAYWRKIQAGYDCVFGSRFMTGAVVVDYPKFKLALNRLANFIIAMTFRVPYYDMTNALKCFRREVIAGIRPILSQHFNVTVELPLKAIIRGYSWTVVPTNWYNRKEGVSKFKVKEMGSRYLFIILYALLEKLLSRGDYHSTRARPIKPEDTSLGGIRTI